MNILITGGSGGIGLATAKVLAEEKSNKVMIASRDIKKIEAILWSFPFKNVIPAKLDLSYTNKLDDNFLKFVNQHFNVLDILINNAGYLYNAPFEKLEENEMRLMMEINFFSPAKLIKILLPIMHRGSHIVNISSMGGFQGSTKFHGLSGYSASKSAIACLTESLAVEFSEYGIHVNCLAPGSVDTEMFRKAFPGKKASLSADEMGKFIAWFALNGHRFFNGKILPVAFSGV